MLLTTHYLEEAEDLADRLAIMHEGRIAAAGTPAEVTAPQPSRISFDLPEGYFAGDLPPLAELGVSGHEEDGPAVRLRTHELQRAATAAAGVGGARRGRAAGAGHAVGLAGGGVPADRPGGGGRRGTVPRCPR